MRLDLLLKVVEYLLLLEVLLEHLWVFFTTLQMSYFNWLH